MRTPFVRRWLFLFTALAAATALSGCESPAQTALLGAAIGSTVGEHPLRNAAIGAGVGYAAGRLAEHERDRYGENTYGRERRYDRHPAYPIGEPSGRYGFITSPYPPHNLIDVRGIPHGAKVLDPSVRRVFINP